LTLAKLKELGVKLIPVELPKFPVNDLAIILSAEAGAAFDDLTRSNRDDLLVRQIKMHGQMYFVLPALFLLLNI